MDVVPTGAEPRLSPSPGGGPGAHPTKAVGTRAGIPPSPAYVGHLADDPGTGMGSPWNQGQAWDASVGEGHDVADLGPCTINGLGEVSDEAYSHRTTEGPERTPVA